MRIVPGFRPAVTYRQLNRVLLRLGGGDGVEAGRSMFEAECARYLGVRHAVLVPSGRWGLRYILKSLNLRPGDEVILPSFTYFAVPAAVVSLGLKPVFADISAGGMGVDPAEIERNITPRTRVIIPTHLCGFACGMDAVMDIGRKYGVKVVEDCCQSLGAEYAGRKLGSFGDAAYFTFGITKHFMMLGGGCVATDDAETAARVRSLSLPAGSVSYAQLFLALLAAYGMKLGTSPVFFSGVYALLRMFSAAGIDIADCIFRERRRGTRSAPGLPGSIQAELGLAQLARLDYENEERRAKGTALYGLLKGAAAVSLPVLKENARNIFSTCPIMVREKKKFRHGLLKKGIDSSAGYMQDCSSLPMFSSFARACPVSARRQEEVLYLPLYRALGCRELSYVAEAVRAVAAECA